MMGQNTPDTQVSGYIPTQGTFIPVRGKAKPAKAGSLSHFSGAAVHFSGHGFAAAGRLNVWRSISWRRWCTLLFALMMVFSVAGGIRGQDTSQRMVTISCSAESQSVMDVLTTPSPGGAWLRGEKMEGHCYGDITNRIRGNLNEANISLSLIQRSRQDYKTPATTDLLMYTTMDIHGAPLLVVYPLSSPEPFKNTAIPAPHMETMISIYVIEGSDNLAAADFSTGILLYQLGDCDSAIQHFDEADKAGFYIDDGSPDLEMMAFLNFYQGNCALLKGDNISARRYYENAFSPAYRREALLTINLQANLAWTYLQEGDEAEAFDLMDRAVEEAKKLNYRNPIQIEAFTKRAQLYTLAERYDDAITDLTTALELDSQSPELYTLRGQMYLALYEWDKALTDYNAALELAPDYADAYYYRGVLYASILQTGLDKRDDALADFRRYLDLAPDGDHAGEAAQTIADLEAANEALDE